jgi:hypothetical protein
VVDVNKEVGAELDRAAAKGRKPQVNKAAAKKKVGAASD